MLNISEYDMIDLQQTKRDDFTQVMLEREALVLELLIQEGYFEGGGKSHESTQNGIV